MYVYSISSGKKINQESEQPTVWRADVGHSVQTVQITNINIK